MRKRLTLGLFVTTALFSLGCQGTVTPFTRGPERVDDPMLSTAEQRVRARSAYAYPDNPVGNVPGQSTWREYYYR